MLTWGDIGAFFAVLVVVSFVAGAVDAWREQRKWDKTEGGEDIGWLDSSNSSSGRIGRLCNFSMETAQRIGVSYE